MQNRSTDRSPAMENNAMESMMDQLQQQLHSLSLRQQRAEDVNVERESTNIRERRDSRTAYVDRAEFYQQWVNSKKQFKTQQEDVRKLFKKVVIGMK
jgi:CRP-like cAMP-binding protein